MTDIHLSHSHFDDANKVAELLSEADIAVSLYDIKTSSKLPPSGLWVHIAQEQSLIKLGEEIYRLRGKLPGDFRLLLCAPSFPDPSKLQECGASTLVTPYTWAAHDVTERILGEILLQETDFLREFGELRGGTKKMRLLYEDIRRLAKLQETVFIRGEKGTGKELVAHVIHKYSPYAKGKFLPVNCGCFGKDTIASELFGHCKGAFTDAKENKEGIFQAAGQGTIFLDEIGELPLEMQSQLLRVVEEKKIRPLGATQYIDTPARLLLATNRNLEEACQKGLFRDDLYDRIRGFEIVLPPLREHKADIPLLVYHFVQEYNHKYKRDLIVPSGCLDRLFRYDWPGNVRELRSAVWRAAAYAEEGKSPISVPHLYDTISLLQKTIRQGNTISFDPESDTWADIQERMKKAYFLKLLEYTNNDKRKAAEMADISRSQFYEIFRDIS